MNCPIEEKTGARDSGAGLVHVVIDTPKGSRNKYKYDAQLGLFRLSKVLPLGSNFPYDFGFILATRAEDGDALDVLVLYNDAGGRQFKPMGRHEPKVAEKLVEDARRSFKEHSEEN